MGRRRIMPTLFLFAISREGEESGKSGSELGRVSVCRFWADRLVERGMFDVNDGRIL